MGRLTISVVQDLLNKQSGGLSSTQEKLCLPILNRFYNRMMDGNVFSPIKVDGNLIIDGHHRYIAAKLAGYNLDKVISFKTSATRVYEWSRMIVEEQDWENNAVS